MRQPTPAEQARQAQAHVGTCDYTSLRWRVDAAVHSGDRTDAPPPDGASEFLDLDLEALARTEARYLVVSIFSYNNVAFEDMAEAILLGAQLHVADGGRAERRRLSQRKFEGEERREAGAPEHH